MLRIVVVFAGLLILPGFALAEDKPLDFADKKAAECMELSREERDSGVTARMRSGMQKSVICLKAAILQRAEDAPLKKQDKVARLSKAIDVWEEQDAEILWMMHNERDDCSAGMCGTMYQVTYLGDHYAMLTQMLRNIDHSVQELRQMSGS